jgi:hypothetical protein
MGAEPAAQPSPTGSAHLPAEVVARAILYAAEHPERREYWVGGSTVGTLLGDKFAPGLLDRYLARTGYKAQQGKQPADPNAPVNLWSPADGSGDRDFGAHGAFDAKAVNRSSQVWLSQRHGLLATFGDPRGSGRPTAVAPITRWTLLQDDKDST